jgi:3-oxoadipate enol-lactonase
VATAAIGEIEINYTDHGAGMPLLLIAGFPAVLGDWAPISDPLRAGRRVVAYDSRGSGGSSVTPGPYSTAELAADAVGLLDHLGIPRADVFGVSLGGMVAQELAIGWPNRVDRLILGATHAGLANAAPQPRDAGKAFAMETGDWGERVRALAPYVFADGAEESLLEAFIEAKLADPQDAAGYRALLDAELGHDSFDRLDEIDAPTLVISGEDDRVMPGLSSELLREQISAARLEIVSGAGHLFFIEQPEQTLAAIEDFLDSTPAPG